MLSHHVSNLSANLWMDGSDLFNISEGAVEVRLTKQGLHCAGSLSGHNQSSSIMKPEYPEFCCGATVSNVAEVLVPASAHTLVPV